MTLTMREIETRLARYEKDKDLAVKKIEAIETACKTKKASLDEKCKADKQPYEEKVKSADKEINRLTALKTKFEKLQAEFFGE